jgi:hypothetical protein
MSKSLTACNRLNVVVSEFWWEVVTPLFS